MILIDANLLIYAVNTDAPQHAVAHSWVEKVLSQESRVGLAWIVLLAFLRITTKRGIFEQPLSPEQARKFVDDWLRLPIVRTVSPGPNHWPILRNLLVTSGMAGNLTSDAHLAALAIEQGYRIATSDHDFRRLPRGRSRHSPVSQPHRHRVVTLQSALHSAKPTTI